LSVYFKLQVKSELNNTLLEQQREIEKLTKDIKKGEKKRKEQEDELARLRAEKQQQQQQQQPLDSARSMMSAVTPDTSRTSASM
jgi:septal ring factor EnvC (AmiA/AmiB activator)